MSSEEKALEMVRHATKVIRIKLAARRMAIVKCMNFKCMGVMGQDGIWRDAHDRPLEVIEVETEF